MQYINKQFKQFFKSNATSSSRLAAIEAHIDNGGSVIKNAAGEWELLGESQPVNNTMNQYIKYTTNQLACNLQNLIPNNVLLNTLPGDHPSDSSISRYNIPNVCYSLVNPTPFTQPSLLISISSATAELLHVTLPQNQIESDQLCEFMSGNNVLPQCIDSTWCHRYAGHQFHQFAGQLGDGRAVSLLQTNVNNQLYELQLKGSGRTPYSRGFDGRAVLRSSLREYLMCEHMNALNVPTTRALTLTVNNDKVRRDALERCSVVSRTANCFIRFGSFEIHYYADEKLLLQQLADYTIKYFYNHIHSMHPLNSAIDAFDSSKPYSKRYSKFIECVTHKTAILIAHWSSIYFVHSVMNTDNMSIIGITLDYAPPSLLGDEYRPSYVSNDTDDTGMYSFENQVKAAKFNLDKLAKCFTELCTDSDLLDSVNQFDTIYNNKYIQLMKQKIGLQQNDVNDQPLIESLMNALSYTQGVDYTYFFRRLFNTLQSNDTTYTDVLLHAGVPVDYHSALIDWCVKYNERLRLEHYNNDSERHSYCNQYNANYILRAYLLDQAYEQAKQNDYSMIDELLDCMTQPFGDNIKYQHFAHRAPEYYNNLTCSCSS